MENSMPMNKHIHWTQYFYFQRFHEHHTVISSEHFSINPNYLRKLLGTCHIDKKRFNLKTRYAKTKRRNEEVSTTGTLRPAGTRRKKRTKTKNLEHTYFTASIADTPVEFLPIEYENVIGRADDAALGRDGACSVDVVSSYHADSNPSALTLLYSVRHLTGKIKHSVRIQESTTPWTKSCQSIPRSRGIA